MEAVTEEDLQWWLELSRGLDWTWAKTYADSAPHHYVVLGRTEGITREDFVRAAHVIHTFGEPGQFWGHVNIYLVDPVTGMKFWTMDDPLEATDLINRAKVSEVYGPQDAPSTAAARHSFYDQIAVGYDDMWKSESDAAEDEAVRRLIVEHFGAYAPSVLDVGCGTGLMLDLKITSPALFTGLDPSQGMLNRLVMKHPRVRELIPATAEDGLPPLVAANKRYDLVCSTFAAASYLSEPALRDMHRLSGDMLLLMAYEEGYLPDYWVGEARIEMLARTNATRLLIHDLAKEWGADQFMIGRFEVTKVTR